MKAIVAILLLLLSVGFVIPVAGHMEHMPLAAIQIEHALTPEQCKADADAWGIPTASVLFRNEAEFDQLSAATALNRIRACPRWRG